LFKRHWYVVAVKPDGTAVSVNVPAAGTAAVGAPLIEALTVAGVTEDAPAILPAAAAGATAVNFAARLAVGASSYEYVGVNTVSVSVVPVVPVKTFPKVWINPPPVLLRGLETFVNWLRSTSSWALAKAAMPAVLLVIL